MGALFVQNAIFRFNSNVKRKACGHWQVTQRCFHKFFMTIFLTFLKRFMTVFAVKNDLKCKKIPYFSAFSASLHFYFENKKVLGVIIFQELIIVIFCSR